MTIFTSKATAYGHYGLASYQIEVDLTDPRRPLQRHIWTHDDGVVEAEPWIPTINETPAHLLAMGWTQRAA